MWGYCQLGTSMTIQGKGKSVWTHQMLSGFQTTAEWVFCVCCRCWPCPSSGSSAGICCWHLELMNTKRNSSPLNQQLSAYSALAVAQKPTLLPSGSWVLSLRYPKAGSCQHGNSGKRGRWSLFSYGPFLHPITITLPLTQTHGLLHSGPSHVTHTEAWAELLVLGSLIKLIGSFILQGQAQRGEMRTYI